MQPRLLTTAEAAEQRGVTQSRIRSLISEGRIRTIVRNGRHYCQPEDVHTLLPQQPKPKRVPVPVGRVSRRPHGEPGAPYKQLVLVGERWVYRRQQRSLTL